MMMEKREEMPRVDPDAMPEIKEIDKIKEVPDPSIIEPQQENNPARNWRASGQIIYQ